MRRVLATLSFIFLAACSSEGTSFPPSTQLAAQNEIRLALPAASTPVPASSDLLYVGNRGNNSITVYRHDAQGDTAPLYVIAGSKTGINEPGQLSEDAAGNLYIANTSSILVFAHGAKGNVPPIRKIAGPATGLGTSNNVTVDKLTGKVFVASNALPYPTLLRFPPNSSGNAVPFAVEAIGNLAIGQIDSDSTGRNVIFTGPAYCCNVLLDGSITTPKQYANGAQTSIAYETEGTGFSGLVDDPSTKTFLISGGLEINNSGGIVRLAEDTTGSATHGLMLSPPPVSIITSAWNCGQLSLGYLRNIYAVCGSEVHVYMHDASGDAEPLRILSGSSTRLNQPYGIYEGK